MGDVDNFINETVHLIENFSNLGERDFIPDRLWQCFCWQETDSHQKINSITKDLYNLFCKFFDENERFSLYNYVKNHIEQGDFSSKPCLAFILHDHSEGIVSTASLDLLAYSLLNQNGLPNGINVIDSVLRNRIALCPGAIFGAAVSFGDARLAKELGGLFPFLMPRDIEMAARMQTGLITHFAMAFWINVALANVDNTDPASLSVVGSAASAMVLARRLTRDPVVVDVQRHFPANRVQERIVPLKIWSLDEFATYMADDLYELERRERDPKVFPVVIKEWGLR